MKRILTLLVVVALGGGAFYYFTRPVTSLVLTGVVTTNDVVVSSQIGGRIGHLAVTEGDSVTREQLIAVIAPDELRAESAFAARNAEGVGSQIRQAQASLRWEELQLAEQVRQAESSLAATEAQQAAAVADLEGSRLNFERTQNLPRRQIVRRLMLKLMEE